MIGLVDGNNFFVSCERVFDPALEGKPVAVLSNNDGCCISRSNEFKALRIPMGTPLFQLAPLIERYGLLLRSSNYALYGDMSRRIIAVLREFVPEVQQYSIDEAFIFPQFPEGTDWRKFGVKIRETLLKWTGIPCGIGFAPTRTLAKIANHKGKKSPSGVFVMPEDPSACLAELPVGEVWGVGRRLAPKLEKSGIRTAQDLARQEPEEIRKRHSVTLARTVMELRGISCIEDRLPEEPSQSITCSRSFGHPVTELGDLEESVATYIAKAAEKLRKEKLTAAGIQVWFQYYPEYGPAPLAGGNSAFSFAFPSPENDPGRMMKLLRPKLKELFLPGRRYKKSGVLFFGLEPGTPGAAGDLFAPSPGRDAGIFEVVDKINARFGRGTVFTLGEGIGKPWQMKRERLSDAFTTDWDQLLQVK